MGLYYFDDFRLKDNQWHKTTKEEYDSWPEEEKYREAKIGNRSIKIKRTGYLDKFLFDATMFWKAEIKRNKDRQIIIDGVSGCGKAAVETMILRVMSDEKFNPATDLVGADIHDYLDKLEKAKNGDCLGLDDAQGIFDSMDFMKTEQKYVHKLDTINRQMNLFRIIVVPSIFRINSYFALDRSCALIHCYEVNGERGYFSFFNTKDKYQLYEKGKKFHNHLAHSPTFRGRFTKSEIVETPEYKEFKAETLKQIFSEARSKIEPKVKLKSTSEMRREWEKDFVRKNKDKYPKAELGRLLDRNEKTIFQYVKEIEQLKVVEPVEDVEDVA